ncbi:hypothetical protein CXZ10_17070 [Pleomorphomonas diazotrophica]|uniref:Uncharacterized protein n=1 Tax=Pleomorphomonas diazotrophica TaxID=1166257 RepID=A0A1I4RNF1_9HYPH|nr:hypothetical protein [Pleomorphomonas diazotrophica]PKR88157.1 hypothetical protein CXZ10_17070 [Pleomorphomonas diazotrophica]SFM53795.1 hypothetical protein SAMN05192571_102129 [Pleomorphomonas diazotrophica]
MTRLSCLWLTSAVLAAPLLIDPAIAGDSGTTFQSVAIGDCAAAKGTVCLTAPLVSGAPTTALDVLSDIYPGLGPDGAGKRFAGAEAVEAASDPEAGEPADRAVNIATNDSAEIAVVEAGTKAYAAAMSNGVVTVAEVKPAYRPLGRLLVDTDPGEPTYGYRLLLAAPSSPVVVTVSSHFNSEEGFDSFHLVGVVKDELVDLYDGPYLYSFAQATEQCEILDHRENVAVFETVAAAGRDLADVAIIIDYAATCTNGDATQPVDKKSFPIRLTFEGARYDGVSSALDDFNAKFTE